MMPSRIGTALLIVMLIPVWQVHSATTIQSEYFTSISGKLYSTRHGLPSNVIKKIFQDKSRYLWVCTEQGLGRYNGQSFKVFDDFPEGVSMEVTTSLIDSHDVFWMGTTNGLITRKNNTFLKVELPIPGLKHYINNIVEDGSGNIWLTSNGQGPYKLVNGQFVLIKSKIFPEGSYIFDLESDSSGNIWIASASGFYVITDDKFKRYHLPEIASYPSGKFILNGADEGWYANTDGLLEHFKEGKTETLRFAEKGQDIEIYCVVKHPLGSIWIGTSKGIYIFQNKEWEHFSVINGLASNLVFCIFFDYEQTLWYGSDNGIGKVFGLQFRQIKPRRQLAMASINDLAEDSHQRLWVATSDGLFQKDKDIITHWSSSDGLMDDFILSLLELPDGAMLVSSSSRIFAVRDQRINIVLEKQLSSAYDMVIGPQDKIWIAREDGIFVLNGNLISKVNQDYGLPDNLDTTCLYFDKQKRLFVGTNGNGAFILDSKSMTSEQITGLPDDRIFSFFHGKQGMMWIGTLNGACCLEDDKVKIVYTRKYGLNSNHIWTVLQDYKGVTWFATSRGLSCLKNGRIFNYNVDDGISGDDFTSDCAMVDSQKHIWFGGSGITIVNPDYTYPITSPSVNIEKASVNGRKLIPDEKLPHNMKNVEFTCACLSFANESKNMYRYQLLGYDQHRSLPSKSPYIRYTNLPTGTFRLEVEAMNRDGYWSKQPASFEFEILPAIWEIPWVQMAGLVLVLMVIFFLIRLRVARINKSAQQLKSEVDRQMGVIKKQIETLEKQKNELENLAVTDHLTKISNRRYFFRVLINEWKRQDRNAKPLSVILFDIDHFKEVNDTFGHSTGDSVLIELTQVMQQNLRGSDTLARFGGEEFIVLLPETGMNEAVDVAERIRKAIRDLKIQSQAFGMVMVQISGGVSTKYGKTGAMNPDALIQQADSALYRAKQEGRNRISTYRDRPKQG